MFHLRSVFVLLVVACCLAGVGAQTVPAPDQGIVSLPVDGGRLTIQPLLDNAVRVRFTRDDQPTEPSLILTEKVPTPASRVNETETAIALELPKLHASVDRATGAITFRDAEGRVLLRELPGTRRLEAGAVQGEPTWAVAQSFDSPETERLFGTGQFQDGFLNVRDLPRRLTQVNTQIAIPFVVSSRGFGLLWHNYGLTEFNPTDESIALTASDAAGTSTSVDVTTTEGTRREVRHERAFTGSFTTSGGRHAFFLDVGQKMARRWHVEIDGKPVIDFANLWLPPTTSWFTELAAGEHTVRVEGVKDDQPVLTFRPARSLTEFVSPVAEALDYVFIAGEGDQITAAYRQLTGPVPMMPRWALGYIHCRERFKSQAELLENAAEFRARNMPMDVIVQDWQYWGRHGWNAMRFDEADYPDPAAMVRTLHEQHTRLMVSVWSKVDPSSELGREFVARDYFIPGTQWVDFFNPAASAFYWENFRTRLLPLGIDAWWLDATEPENDDLIGRRIHTGAGEIMRNIYPLFVSRTVYEGLRRDAPDRRAMILTRSAFPGQQRYASATWSGDIGNSWDTLRRQVAAGLDYVVTGLPWWTTDTGGFFRPGPGQYTDSDFHERFLRWLQYSTFTPLQRVHGYQTDTEPWRYGALVDKESRRWLELRQRLMPYIYSEAARVSFEGSTLMRPLVLDFPRDAQALDQTAEFMFGPALLVAPVLAPGVGEWPVFLPRTEGGWFDFWTGQRFAGGQTVSAAAPLERIPLFARAGSIVPMGEVKQYVTERPDAPYEIRVYPGADAKFTIYEDDNESYAYEHGERATYDLNWDEVAKTLRIGARQGSFPGMTSSRELKIVLVEAGSGASRTVVYRGEPLSVAFEPFPVATAGANPIFRDAFTADPAAMVLGDTVYAYVGIDNAKVGEFFTMPEWRCYSSRNMKNWTPHGVIMRPEEFKFARPNVAWASHVVAKNGRFYLYATLRRSDSNEHCIGVAVADNPTGPFKDARGTPLITDGMTTDSRRANADIDPAVFIDDDGTAWLIWGNGDFYLAKLQANMTELDGPIRKLSTENIAEGPWLFKRGKLYYNVYAADVPGTQPEQIAYATAPAVEGPWTYRGLVTGPAKNGFTIHPAVIEFKGQWYFFYHDGSTSLNGLPGGDCRRSVCLEYLHFNPDGSIRPVTQTAEGVSVPPER